MSAGFNGFDCHALRAMRRDDDHERRVSVAALELTQKIETAHAGKIYVEQEQVGFVLFQESTGGFGGACFGDVVTECGEGSPHAVSSGFLIVNNH
jgi:hypothetical protein